MRYTNKHIKEAYSFYKVLLYTFLGLLATGMVLLIWGLIAAYVQMNNVLPLENVLSQSKNPANKTAYIEVIDAPQKIAEDKHEEYYLVKTESEVYISGMQKEQYEALLSEVETNGKAKLEGMTKVIIDEQVLEKVAEYANEDKIHLRATKLNYFGILKEGYIINLILGGILAIISLIVVLGAISEINKYRHPKSKQIDEECNRADAVWISEYSIYLTDSFLVSIGDGMTAIDIDKIDSVTLSSSKQGDVTMEAGLKDGSKIKVFEKASKDTCIYEEEREYFESTFGSKNISFICNMEVLPEEEY